MLGVIVIIVVLLAVAILAVSQFNKLRRLDVQAQGAWAGVDTLLTKRADLVPNLVETVRGALEHERTTLESVVAARQRAVDATGPRQSAAAEQGLTQALGRLFAVVEGYPDLKANQNVLALQEELTNTENLIAFARQHYNDLVGQYDTRRQSFPINVMMGRDFPPREYFTAAPDETATPRVDLSGIGTPRPPA